MESKYPSVIYSRFKILHEQGYIAKNYDKSYRLQGKPASYFLLPKALKQLKGKEGINEKLLIYMRRDHKRSQNFIDHHIAVLGIYTKLWQLYVNSKANNKDCLILTKNGLAAYEIFPSPRPDIYFYFLESKQKLDFMVEYFQEAMPWFVIKRQIARYIDHIENGDWVNEANVYPTILLITETIHLKKRLIKHITNSLEQMWIDELHFALCTFEDLTNCKEKTDVIWLPVNDEVGALSSLEGLPRN